MSATNDAYYLGIFEGHADPAVAIVRNGELLAYAEEERHLRNKHAYGLYPRRALQYCLDVAGISLDQVAAVGVNWNMPSFGDGSMQRFYDEQVNSKYAVDERSRGWQRSMINRFSPASIERIHHLEWRQMYGDIEFPKLHPVGHHYTHAYHACAQSGFDKSLCITIDGSGDEHCTVLWRHDGEIIEPIKEICIPHSLGWLYAAVTEYLGFRAYDGEYKVMGLAAYGRENADLRKKLTDILKVASDGVGYEVDPTFVHYGDHNYSGRFTDKFLQHFGRKPRLPHEDIDKWHEDLAFEMQHALEVAVERLVQWGLKETGFDRVCIGGGVGLNIKMNSRLFRLVEVRELFAQPLCSDGGAAAGVALATCFELGGGGAEKLESLALGFEETNENIERVLKLCGVDYEKPTDICEVVAGELSKGRIVGWFQGRMEAGPRALGQRSILADPRKTENRDKVNAIIKFREYWRPFCPSMVVEACGMYFDKVQEAPFMILAFDANDKLKDDAPAIVHVDGTARVQLVKQDVNPRYHALISRFGEKTGVPCLLNTSFNIKGEPIVCTVHDALRTFWATGLEVLAVGDYLLKKPRIDP